MKKIPLIGIVILLIGLSLFASIPYSRNDVSNKSNVDISPVVKAEVGIWNSTFIDDLLSLVEGISSVCALGVPGPIWSLSNRSIPFIAGDEDTTPVPSVVAVASGFGSGSARWTS